MPLTDSTRKASRCFPTPHLFLVLAYPIHPDSLEYPPREACPPLSYTGNEILLQTHFSGLSLTLVISIGSFRSCLKTHSFQRKPTTRWKKPQLTRPDVVAYPHFPSRASWEAHGLAWGAILLGSDLLRSILGLTQTQQRKVSQPSSPPPNCTSCGRMDRSRGGPSCREVVCHVRLTPYSDTTREASRHSLPPTVPAWHNPQTPSACSALPGRHEHCCLTQEMRYCSDRTL